MRPLIYVDICILRTLFQPAADLLSPWIGCYRLARYAYLLGLIIAYLAPLTIHDRGTEIFCLTAGMSWTPYVLGRWRELRRMDDIYNRRPLAGPLYWPLRIVMLITLGGLMVIMSDRYEHNWTTGWAILTAGAYLECCVQKQPPVERKTKPVHSFA